MPPPSSYSFIDRLRNAGIEPGDSEQEQLNKTLLFFATGLVSLTSMLWLVIYWVLGPQLSATLPFFYQILLTANLLFYVHSRNFDFFRTSQLGLFLFAPFVMQWTMGNVINSSGIALWALMAPIGAILCIGVRQASPWFFAWVFLMLFSWLSDFYLVGQPGVAHIIVPARTTVTFFSLNFLAVAAVIFVLLRYSALEKEAFRVRLEEQHGLVQLEHARSEALLLNILPAPVAARLKHTNDVIADGFPQVTVMFADISKFTEMAGSMAPTEVFATLNEIFSKFDEMAERHGVEKIKTIGDAYMVASGLNLSNRKPAHAIAALAIDMQNYLQSTPAVNAGLLQLHIGISTGPVVAGVIGRKKFIYDLWGNTVNIASRITEIAPTGKIWLDEETRKLLGNSHTFTGPYTARLKGKGDAELYELNYPSSI